MGGRVLGEYGADAGDVRAEFIWMSPQVGDSGQFGGDDGLGGYMPLAVATTGGTLSWVHANHMVVPILYSDSTGAAIAPPGGYSVPGFPGQNRTPGLGGADLYYNRYRDYDPSTGRYIQADPIGLAGGPSPYSYAMNNPLRYSDPTGECPICVAILGGIILGAGTDIAIQAGMNWSNGRDVFDTNCYDWEQVAISGGLGGLTGGAGAWLRAGARAGGAAAASGQQLVPLGALPLGAWGEARLAQAVGGGFKPRIPLKRHLAHVFQIGFWMEFRMKRKQA